MNEEVKAVVDEARAETEELKGETAKLAEDWDAAVAAMKSLEWLTKLGLVEQRKEVTGWAGVALKQSEVWDNCAARKRVLLERLGKNVMIALSPVWTAKEREAQMHGVIAFAIEVRRVLETDAANERAWRSEWIAAAKAGGVPESVLEHEANVLALDERCDTDAVFERRLINLELGTLNNPPPATAREALDGPTDIGGDER